jgi:hypothetical protein
MAKGGKKDNEQRHQTGIQGKKVVVGILAAFADLLRCFDVQLVLLQQMVLVLIAVFFRRAALKFAGQRPPPMRVFRLGQVQLYILSVAFAVVGFVHVLSG